MGTPPLVDDIDLEQSDVVANSTMNRQRRLTGVNSYNRELGINPVEELLARAERADAEQTAAWLDVCCGTGRALLDASEEIQSRDLGSRVRLVGLDLVEHFDEPAQPHPWVELVCGNVATWIPDRRFDVITCVHGLHYVGDKLLVLARMACWLEPSGFLIADFDPSSVRLADGSPAGRALNGALRKSGFEIDTRRRRVTLRGARAAELPYRYLGADDRAGPNYTGQPAVHSYYSPI